MICSAHGGFTFGLKGKKSPPTFYAGYLSGFFDKSADPVFHPLSSKTDDSGLFNEDALENLSWSEGMLLGIVPIRNIESIGLFYTCFL